MPTIDDYIRDLKSRNINTRKAAVAMLGESGDAKALEPLLKALTDESPSVQAYAVSALSTLYQVTPPLRAARERILWEVLPSIWTAQPGLQISTLKLLAVLRATEATKAILGRLDDEDLNVREEAFKTLAQIGDMQAIPQLASILQDGDADKQMRLWAAEALGELRDAEAVQPLLAGLKDEEPAVRHTAVSALARIGDKQAAEAVRALLKDSSDNVRYEAIQAAVVFNDRAAIPVLRIMARDDTGWGHGEPMSKVAARAAQAISDRPKDEPQKAASKSTSKGKSANAPGLLGRLLGLPLALLKRRKPATRPRRPRQNRP